MDIKKMKQEMEEELVSNILPFWINRMTDEVNGGFYGRITGREEVKPEAEKGAILNARILWTFSAAYRLLKRPEYLETATRAKRTLIDRFYDNELINWLPYLPHLPQPLVPPQATAIPSLLNEPLSKCHSEDAVPAYPPESQR